MLRKVKACQSNLKLAKAANEDAMEALSLCNNESDDPADSEQLREAEIKSEKTKAAVEDCENLAGVAEDKWKQFILSLVKPQGKVQDFIDIKHVKKKAKRAP